MKCIDSFLLNLVMFWWIIEIVYAKKKLSQQLFRPLLFRLITEALAGFALARKGGDLYEDTGRV